VLELIHFVVVVLHAVVDIGGQPWNEDGHVVGAVDVAPRYRRLRALLRQVQQEELAVTVSGQCLVDRAQASLASTWANASSSLVRGPRASCQTGGH
jgi:hypothetical protein